MAELGFFDTGAAPRKILLTITANTGTKKIPIPFQYEDL